MTRCPHQSIVYQGLGWAACEDCGEDTFPEYDDEQRLLLGRVVQLAARWSGDIWLPYDHGMLDLPRPLERGLVGGAHTMCLICDGFADPLYTGLAEWWANDPRFSGDAGEYFQVEFPHPLCIYHEADCPMVELIALAGLERDVLMQREAERGRDVANPRPRLELVR